MTDNQKRFIQLLDMMELNMAMEWAREKRMSLKEQREALKETKSFGQKSK